SHAGDTTIPPRGRYAGELPLAPTLHIYANTSHYCMYMPRHIHRAQIHRMQTSSRSCRGEWKLARNTRNAYISPRRGHNNTTTGTIRGRASTRPYTACICQHITACTCRNTHATCKSIARKPHRVAVGASGSSPETHAMHPFPHAGDATIPPQRRYAGELPLAPTLHIYI
ncbi:MAG: hypothetical protein K2G49_10555, partial [Muribaculum sp.]|nr:hypothetical protein [Muribaculum sp.]